MYVYFDRTGTIREIISEPIRQGSSSNYIYCYFEGGDDIDGLWWTEKKSDGTIAQPETMTTLKITKPLPYDLVKDRDLKYFNEYERYPFWTIQLQTSNLNVDGLTLLTIRAMVDSDIYAQGLLTFEIESGVINYDNVITQSQYDYLLQLYAQRYDRVGYVELDPDVDGNTITDEQLAEIQKDICVIYCNSWYYLKTDVDDYPPNISFTMTYGWNATSQREIYFDNSRIIVDVESKTYSIDDFASGRVYTKEAINYIVPEFEGNTIHFKDDMRFHNGKVYKCKEQYTGSWDASKWESLSIAYVLKGKAKKQYRHLVRFYDNSIGSIYAIIISSYNTDLTGKKMDEIVELEDSTFVNSMSFYSDQDSWTFVNASVDLATPQFNIWYIDEDDDGTLKYLDWHNKGATSDTITEL